MIYRAQAGVQSPHFLFHQIPAPTLVRWQELADLQRPTLR